MDLHGYTDIPIENGGSFPRFWYVYQTHRIHVCARLSGNIYHQYTPNVSIYSIHGSYGRGYAIKKPPATHIRILLGITGPQQPASPAMGCSSDSRRFVSASKRCSLPRCAKMWRVHLRWKWGFHRPIADL